MSKLMTTSTLGISSPRDATSVAIKMFLSFALKRLSALSRYCCESFPLMFTALKLRKRRVRANFNDWLQVDVKMISFLPANRLTK